jgi:putative ABC transport system substrate-binding protein
MQGAGAVALGLLAGCGRLPWQANSARVPRIGVLFGAASTSSMQAAALRQGLREHGYVEGRNVEVVWRTAEGHVDRLPDLASLLWRSGRVCRPPRSTGPTWMRVD